MYQILPTPRLSARIGGIGRVRLLPFYNRTAFPGEKASACLTAFSDYADRAFSLLFEEGEGGLTLEKDASLPFGGYALIAGIDGKVKLAASEEEGLSHGLATLLLAAEKAEDGKALSLPLLHLCDEPQGSWRGLMVDVARKFHPIRFLYDTVDLCWLYKINRLQLHFTDDESDTLPSEAFPKLPTAGRHYTKAQLTALDEYAASRGVTIVPEVDMPGHSTPFGKAYPELFGSHGILCSEEKTYKALETLIAEVASLFPNAPYLHLGGDEAQIARWERCPGCQAYCREKGIASTQELYAHFLSRVTNYTLSLGRTPILWEGFAKEYNHLISKKTLVIAWESYYQIAPDLLEGGFSLLNCSWQPLYIVTPTRHWEVSEILDWNIYTWRHFWEKSVASKRDITVSEGSPIVGGQLCAWGDRLVEYPSNEQAAREGFALIRRRLPSLAEKTWNIHSDLSSELFEELYAHTDALLDKLLRRD